EEYLPQVNEQNKMLKETLVSRLRFEPERAEVLLMVKGRYIVSEPTDSSEKDNSELSSSVEKKNPILHTAVYRPNTDRKQKETIKVEGSILFDFRLSRTHKKGREESVCQPTSMSEHETMKLKRSITKRASLMSKNEILKKTLPVTSAYEDTEMQTTVLEPSCHEKTCEQLKVERSSKKLLRTRVHSYDRTEPIDDDVIIHILRLRGKLGWQTELPSCERLAREADVTRFQKFTLMKPLPLKDSGEYIYCLERNRNNFKVPYNPYDLEVVSTNTAMQSKEYWIITASFVSKVLSAVRGEIEITSVPQWLRERHLYSRLLNLNLFSNFR
ncbi:DYH14 protein, partial [Glaucidium brasilianum]|nr:DYH14 protein [Glaucidium brasilianum]